MEHTLFLLGAGLLAGILNAVGGGGSFVSFPALIYAGVPSVAANATNTVALFPGALASAYAFRRVFRRLEGVPTAQVVGLSLIGSVLGAVLLLTTPSSVFDRLVPWLLLLGALTFAFGRQAGEALRKRVHITPAMLLVFQFLLGIYGGYFGGAVGIMMMAVWSLFGMTDIRALTALRTLLIGMTNAVAVLCFVAAGVIRWPPALVMLAAALAGGWIGAHITLRIPPRHLRAIILVLIFANTFGLFWRIYG